MKYAEPGSLTHGTLRPEDLIPAFMSALDALANQNRYTGDGDELTLTRLNGRVDDLLGALERALGDDHAAFYETSDCVDDYLADLIDLLNAFAPRGHYFGAHEGDGSDFGFWPHAD